MDSNTTANGGLNVKFKWKYVPFIVKGKEDIIKSLTTEDFEGAPITEEPDGEFQMIEIFGTTYYRNIETGEIDS